MSYSKANDTGRYFLPKLEYEEDLKKAFDDTIVRLAAPYNNEFGELGDYKEIVVSLKDKFFDNQEVYKFVLGILIPNSSVEESQDVVKFWDEIRGYGHSTAESAKCNILKVQEDVSKETSEKLGLDYPDDIQPYLMATNEILSTMFGKRFEYRVAADIFMKALKKRNRKLA